MTQKATADLGYRKTKLIQLMNTKEDSVFVCKECGYQTPDESKIFCEKCTRPNYVFRQPPDMLNDAELEKLFYGADNASKKLAVLNRYVSYTLSHSTRNQIQKYISMTKLIKRRASEENQDEVWVKADQHQSLLLDALTAE